jgi:hypothetical protein
MPVSPSVNANAEALGRALEDFLAAHPHCAVLEDGRLLFDLSLANYSVSAERGRCLLHLWSGERNLVRAITAIEARRETLRLESRRFGQSRAQTLTLAPNPDLRTPTARDTARRRYLRMLEQALTRRFPEWTCEAFRSAMDIEHSFGPAYARGMLTRGQSAWAVLGVGAEELPATVDGALTLGILWLAQCREHSRGRRVFHGLRVVLPEGCGAVTRSRMAWLNARVAQWELWELNPATGELTLSTDGEDGNVDVRLAHAFDEQAALERSAVAVQHLQSLLPRDLLQATEIRARGATEIGFSLYGLEYARVRHGLVPGSFARQDEITFGAGPSETRLDEETEDLFRDLMERLFSSRHPEGSTRDALYRLQPERWLESVLRRDLSLLDPALGKRPVYSQVPAVTAAARTLLDLLTMTAQGRLAVLEIKADDDLHLPVQALDYWMRVRMLHRAGEIARRGYFPGLEVSAEDPLLVLVAPALHLHPANEAVLRHFSPEIPWQMAAVDERWRQQCRVVLRKRATDVAGSTIPKN